MKNLVGFILPTSLIEQIEKLSRETSLSKSEIVSIALAFAFSSESFYQHLGQILKSYGIDFSFESKRRDV